MAAANPQSFMILRHDFDGVVSPVGHQVGGLVRESILAAELILDLYESVGHIVQLKREKRPAPVASEIRSRTLSPWPGLPLMFVLIV